MWNVIRMKPGSLLYVGAHVMFSMDLNRVEIPWK